MPGSRAVLPPKHARLRGAPVLDGGYLCLLTTQALEPMGAGSASSGGSETPKKSCNVALPL